MADFRQKLPEEGEFVVATVRSIRNFGAVVTLDEYGGREAFIHLSEVATGWV
ncbi:translation initiation factor IF-2 subunit alpha, partial [mine drainage metagenome]